MKPLPKSLAAFWCTYNVKSLKFEDSLSSYNVFLHKLGSKSAEKLDFFALLLVALLFSQPKTFGASTHIGRQIQVLLDPGKRLSIFLT